MDLVFFTVEGRERLFLRTLKSMPAEIREAAERIIVSCDGAMDMRVVAEAQPDLILVAPQRRGYIHSITDVLNLIRSDLFLWIEDDWNLEKLQKADLDEAVEMLRREKGLLQVRWGKDAPLPENWPWMGDRVRQSFVGFSANPNVCKTQPIREGFRYVREVASRAEGARRKGFETALSEWADTQGFVVGVLDPGDEPAVSHEGYLETTGREWHMVQSVKSKPREYGYIGISPSLPRRVWMFCKLMYASVVLGFAQFISDAHYELAFRITLERRKIERNH